jgi:hypothetical protein
MDDDFGVHRTSPCALGIFVSDRAHRTGWLLVIRPLLASSSVSSETGHSGPSQLPDEVRDCCPDLVGTVLLQQFAALDGDFALVSPTPDGFTDTAQDNLARLAIDEEFRVFD